MRRLEADVFPAFGHKFIDARLRPIFGSSCSQSSDAMLETLPNVYMRPRGQIFRFAIAHGIASRNPAADFKPGEILAEAKTENFARVDAKELPKLLAKMDDYDGDAITRFALKLIAYTFVRTSELIEAPWTEFDLEDARWLFRRSV